MVEFTIHGSTGEHGCPDVKVTVVQTVDGLQFTLEVVSGGQTGDPIADILAFYINFPDSREGVIPSLAITGGMGWTIGGQATSLNLNLVKGDDNVSSANDPPSNVNPNVYDVGMQFGEAGIGADKGDFQKVSFTLLGLTLADLQDATFGLRLTSVGEIGGSREGSCKLEGEWPKVYDICGTKYEDKDLSGGWSSGDVAKAGWTIYLYSDVNKDGAYTEGVDTFVAQATTDGYGKYCFTGLSEGHYVIVEDADGPDGKWYATAAATIAVHLAGADAKDNDFFNARYGKICGIKYEDNDLSGGWSSGDVGKTGWTIYLYADTDGDGKFNTNKDELVAQTTTGLGGKYSFGGLKGGTYFVVEDADGPDGNWFATSDTVLTVEIDKSGEKVGGQNFFNARYGEIYGEKYWDKNGSGTISAGDPLLKGWTIYLYEDTDGNGAFDAGVDKLLKQTTTGADGKYAFTKLAPGKYIVVEDKDGPDGNWTPIGNWWQAVHIDSSGKTVDVDFLNKLEVCFEGLTPGFWRQAQNWRKVTLDPDCKDEVGDPFHGFSKFKDIVPHLSFGAVFKVGDGTGKWDLTWKAGKTTLGFDVDNTTLLDALTIQGGGNVGAFLRHASAAILNACAEEVDYAIPHEELIYLVRDAFGDLAKMTALKGILEKLNELGLEGSAGYQCPILGADYKVIGYVSDLIA